MDKYYMIMLGSNKKIPMVFFYQGLKMFPTFPTQEGAARFASAFSKEEFFVAEVTLGLK